MTSIQSPLERQKCSEMTTIYMYLIMSVICENSIDALRSYSAKKSERLLLLLPIAIRNKIILKDLIAYRLYHCMKTSNTAIAFESFTEILLLHVFQHVSRSWEDFDWGAFGDRLFSGQLLDGVDDLLGVFNAKFHCMAEVLLQYILSRCFNHHWWAVTLKTHLNQRLRTLLWFSNVSFCHLTHLTARTSRHNQVKSAGAHFCPSRIDQKLPIY